jgi:hypothetical protein
MIFATPLASPASPAVGRPDLAGRRLRMPTPLGSARPDGFATRRLTCRPRVHFSTAPKTHRIAASRPATGIVDDIMRRWSWHELQSRARRDPTTEDLQWFEEELDCTLPADYRAFVNVYGWTSFSHSMRFPLQEAAPWGSSAELSCFFGFSSVLARDLGFLTTDTYAELIPNDTIPIGSDSLGNLILLTVSGPDRDRIWFWDRECVGLDGKIDEMIADLEAQGIDTIDLDELNVIRQWESTFPERSARPAGFANIYAVADSFVAFLQSLYPAPI